VTTRPAGRLGLLKRPPPDESAVHQTQTERSGTILASATTAAVNTSRTIPAVAIQTPISPGIAPGAALEQDMSGFARMAVAAVDRIRRVQQVNIPVDLAAVAVETEDGLRSSAGFVPAQEPTLV